MRQLALSAFVLLLLGCGASQPSVPTGAAPAAAPVAAPAAEKVETPKQPTRPAKRERPPAERAKVAQLFQVPQVSRSNAGYNDARQESGGTPHIRLLGFSQLDGQLRALVQIKGETLPVEQGDIVDGVEVVAVDAEGVSFQYAGQRWTSRLFEKLESRPVVVARALSQSSPAASNAPSAPSPPIEVTRPTPPMVEPSPSPSN